MAGTKTEVCGRIKLGIIQPLSPYIFPSSEQDQVRDYIPICRSVWFIAKILTWQWPINYFGFRKCFLRSFWWSFLSLFFLGFGYDCFSCHASCSGLIWAFGFHTDLTFSFCVSHTSLSCPNFVFMVKFYASSLWFFIRSASSFPCYR